MSWLLLRGLGRERRHWGSFPQVLSKACGEAVYSVDLPGFGQLAQQRSPTTMEAIAAALTPTLRQHVDIDKVLGLSLGGMTACALLQQHPQRFTHCVLVNSSSALSPFHWRLRPTAICTLMSLPLLSPAAQEEKILMLVSNDIEAREEATALWLALRGSQPLPLQNIIRQLLAAARFDPKPVAGINGLVIASSRDRLVDSRCSEALAHHFDWPLRRHLNAGHDLAIDDAAWLAAVVCGLPVD